MELGAVDHDGVVPVLLNDSCIISGYIIYRGNICVSIYIYIYTYIYIYIYVYICIYIYIHICCAVSDWHAQIGSMYT